MGTEPESVVNVEPPSGKPRNTRRPKNQKGAIKPEHVEQWIIQGFSIAAMMQNKPWWAIHDPKIEVEPWAAPAAELLNKIPQDKAEQLTEIHAGVAVCLGLGSLVYKRIQLDAMYKREMIRQQTEAAATYDDQEYARARESVPDNREPTPIKGHKPGTGAAPTSPRETLFGYQAGLS